MKKLIFSLSTITTVPLTVFSVALNKPDDTVKDSFEAYKNDLQTRIGEIQSEAKKAYDAILKQTNFNDKSKDKPFLEEERFNDLNYLFGYSKKDWTDNNENLWTVVEQSLRTQNITSDADLKEQSKTRNVWHTVLNMYDIRDTFQLVFLELQIQEKMTKYLDDEQIQQLGNKVLENEGVNPSSLDLTQSISLANENLKKINDIIAQKPMEQDDHIQGDQPMVDNSSSNSIDQPRHNNTNNVTPSTENTSKNTNNQISQSSQEQNSNTNTDTPSKSPKTTPQNNETPSNNNPEETNSSNIENQKDEINSNNGLSKGTTIGIALIVATPIVGAIFGIGLFFYFKKRKNNN